ncbi:hypothetical protein H6P81_011684 [Aristolochia fimbriata]|uniref:Secreted protein n=1 Tax=Aristolochia fimbriata TaxID=158543 RepID=A0AAV7ECJ1_ARIFI|nr:hypothetical protein H6P81_011684 [Aristolochia fimbriata]
MRTVRRLVTALELVTETVVAEARGIYAAPSQPRCAFSPFFFLPLYSVPFPPLCPAFFSSSSHGRCQTTTTTTTAHHPAKTRLRSTGQCSGIVVGERKTDVRISAVHLSFDFLLG